MIWIAENPSPFEQVEAHLVETMFYDEWAPSGKSSVSKPQGTFIPRWEDIQDDPEFDLKELLMRRKKRKEASTSESSDMPRWVRVWTPDGRIVYKLWRCTGPTCSMRGGLEQRSLYKSLMCYVTQEEVTVEKDTQIVAEEKLEEVNLGIDP